MLGPAENSPHVQGYSFITWSVYRFEKWLPGLYIFFGGGEGWGASRRRERAKESSLTLLWHSVNGDVLYGFCCFIRLNKRQNFLGGESEVFQNSKPDSSLTYFFGQFVLKGYIFVYVYINTIYLLFIDI